MALTLNTNIDSLTAQNNLSGSQALLSQSLTRLSSGLRINSAADDAAGLAIAQQFSTQINGTNQAINNANDAVSEAQTAAGALGTIVNNLQSIRTLAVEAANGSNSASDRAALDAQVQQQISEITQIAQQTSFNGSNVLNGSAGTTVYQVGANVGDTIAVNLTQGVQANQIGQYATSTTNVTTTALTSGSLTLSVGNNTAVAIGAATVGSNNATGQAADSAYAAAAAINNAGVVGLTATASTTETTTAGVNVAGGTAGGTYALSINGIQVFGSGGTAIAANGSLSQTALQTAINAVSAQTGVTASSVAGTGDLQLTAADGSNIVTNETVTGSVGVSLTGIDATSGTAVTKQGQLTLSAAAPITIGAGAGAADVGLTASTVLSASTGVLSSANVLTVSAANSTIQSVDSALATVSAFDSQLGAIQNRFTSAVSNLTSTSQNLTQSRSTIQDANFAQETANLTQAQVLEQAGISVLAQANQEPQLILKLLQ
ncbi:MAG: flagellin [Steroidobacteraceae bacterium]|jgi:flagellin